MRFLLVILSLVTLATIPPLNSLRILAIFPLHVNSHFMMCKRLARELAERGHQIDVYSHFPLKKPMPNYQDFSLDGTLPRILNNMTYEVAMSVARPNMKVMQEAIGGPVCSLLELPIFQQLIKNPPKYDVVLVEVFFQNCFLTWKRHLGIPMIGVVTSSLLDWLNEPMGNPFNTAVTPGLWSPYYHPMDFWQRLMNTLEYHKVMFEYRQETSQQDEIVAKYFGPGYPTVWELPKDLDLLLINAHTSIEGIRPFTPSIVPVGGIHIHDDGSELPEAIQSWLDGSTHGCIYISFGSMVRLETFPKPILDAFYATFKAIAPVRVLLKIAVPGDLPPGLPSNVLTQSWLPQIQVLKHKNVRLFVTHGGLMSTQEAIVYRVPMIGIPLFGDQSLNIRLLVRKKISTIVMLDEISEKSLTTAIQEVLRNPIYQDNVNKLSDKFADRPMPALDTAIFWIEYVVRNGKDALRPPVIDMPWWQAKLLDVYGFLLGSILIVIYGCKFVICKILGIFCAGRDRVAPGDRSKKYQ